MLKCPNCETAFDTIKNAGDKMICICAECGVLEQDNASGEWHAGKDEQKRPGEVFSPQEVPAAAAPPTPPAVTLPKEQPKPAGPAEPQPAEKVEVTRRAKIDLLIFEVEL